MVTMNFLAALDASRSIEADRVTLGSAVARMIGGTVLGLLSIKLGWTYWRHKEPLEDRNWHPRVNELPIAILVGIFFSALSLSLGFDYGADRYPKFRAPLQLLHVVSFAIAGLAVLALVVVAFWRPAWAKTGMGNKDALKRRADKQGEEIDTSRSSPQQ
jgi:hypothetical protein